MHSQPPGTGSLDFTTFMRSYQDMVFTTAARICGNDAQAEDIAQEVFIRAYEHFSDLRGNVAAGGWLKTVSRNLAINHLNRYRRRWRLFSEMQVDDDDTSPRIDWETPENLLSDLSAAERGDIVDRALRRLPNHQRLPLVLHYFEGMPYQEIAAKLGVSLAKVKTDIHRGRSALLPELQSAARDTLEN